MSIPRRTIRCYALRAAALAALAALALLAALGVAAPAARADSATPALQQPENLGQPISQFLVLDTVLGHDAAGKPMLYGSTYVVSDQGVWFFAVDPASGDVVKLIHMNDAEGGYHVALAPDGDVYLAPLSASSTANLWRYDPSTGDLGIVATAPKADASFFFGVTVAPWGTVYAGAYPSGKLYAYRPDTGTLTDLGVVVPGDRYPKALQILPGRRLLIGSGTPAHLTIYDIRTGQKTAILPQQYAGYSFAYNVAKVRRNVFVQMVTPDVRILRFDARHGMRFLGETPPQPGAWGMSIVPAGGHGIYLNGTTPDGRSGIFRYDLKSGALTYEVQGEWAGKDAWWVNLGGKSWVTSIGSTGLFGRWNPATGKLVTRQLVLPGAPTNITALGTGPDGKIYGGTYETDSLFSFDPSTGATQVLGHIAFGRTGEILSMASAAGKLFMGSYIEADLTVYDPTKPWAPGTDAGSNPRDLGSMGDQQYRPWDMVAGDDGHVYVATGAAYGQLGGALTSIDESTYAMRSWRYLSGDQNLFALAPGHGEIYVGTTDHGDGADATGDAHLLVFDESSQSVVHQTVPVPGATWIFSLATAGNGKVYGTTDNGKWFSFDPRTRTVTQLGAFPLGTAYGLTAAPDGTLYGTTPDAVFHVDPVTDQVTKIAAVGSDAYRSIAFDSAGRLYFGSGPSLMRLSNP